MSIEWNEKGLREVERNAARALRDKARKAVTSVVCTDHEERVQFAAEQGSVGGNRESIGRIEACCDKAALLKQQALSRALR